MLLKLINVEVFVFVSPPERYGCFVRTWRRKPWSWRMFPAGRFWHILLGSDDEHDHMMHELQSQSLSSFTGKSLCSLKRDVFCCLRSERRRSTQTAGFLRSRRSSLTFDPVRRCSRRSLASSGTCRRQLSQHPVLRCSTEACACFPVHIVNVSILNIYLSSQTLSCLLHLLGNTL